jgi:hypothetical protein
LVDPLFRKEAAMTPHPTRRGLLGGLIAGLLGLLQGARGRAAPQATPTPAVVGTYTYDVGRLTSLTDPLLVVSTFVYDGHGWPLPPA